ncbi:heavy-metal-associated domain-containing protein [Erythrobacter sp. QSSC1-22B]|uniref:heavy-metal-associated domain-containing protein n=1 Tax=Erythrobacter sp. QSSC1-22B TaxID=1860125 RepID=UPI001F1F5B9E|nr:heavy-metal-associated domain-containing protein [Erythrobacter sp. QSSC1-22B]
MRFALPSLGRSQALLIAALALLALCAAAVFAQVDGDRGIAPIAASSDISVTGVDVDVTGDDAEDARTKGWEAAQRQAWERLEGPDLSDSQIAAMVSAIVIEREQLGPRRYIARLGVIFDRQRANAYLGGAAQAQRSAPMLLVPVTVSAGTQLVYEMRNPWQRAWAEYQAGSSRIDYVRPSGAGSDSLLITYGQTGRRSRLWWRNVLDQFSASDVLIPIANLDYSYPGGPVTGRFTARHGPDNRFLASFAMTADNPQALPDMLAQAVTRFDAIFAQALADGQLSPDPTLNLGTPEINPALLRLIEAGQAADARERAESAARERASSAAAETDGTISAAPVNTPPPEGSVALYTVQVQTPDAAAFNGALSEVRAASGVRNAGIRSTAIGGTSVLTVSYAGSIQDLAGALRARGFTVQQGNNALLISR